VASRAVAHIKRGDRVSLVTTTGHVVRVDRTVGADPLLRYLALLEAVDAPPAGSPPAGTPPRAAPAKAAE
jgi:hypothetical protein